jgi:hemerythrin
MKSFEWNESFSVGNELMDTHHRVFFDIVREFSDWSNENSDTVNQRIKFLVEYCVMHLGAEERLMEKAGYPLLENHKAIHSAFSQKVLAVQNSFEKYPASFSANDILKLMQDWFVNHIMETDMGYKPYVHKFAA